jgi:hypothetical protein
MIFGDGWPSVSTCTVFTIFGKKISAMSHHEETTAILSHEELMYNDHIRRGSDFMKIDLFLSARGEYENALDYKPNDVFSKEQIALCNQYISRDRKKVLVIIPLVLGVILAIALL